MRLPRLTLVGPLFEQELARLSRRGTHYLLRCGLAFLLLFAINLLYPDPFETHNARSMANFGRQVFESMSMIQLVVVWSLTPWFASAVLTEEREQKTLDLLLTTTLTSRDIVVGKLAARLVFVGGVILAGVPIFAGLTLFGGISFETLALVYFGTLLNLVAIGGLTAGVAAGMATFRGTVSLMAVILTLIALTPVGPMWLNFALITQAPGLPIVTAFAVVNLAVMVGGVMLAVKSVRPWEREPVTRRPPAPRMLQVRQRIAPPPVPTGLRANFRWDKPSGHCEGPSPLALSVWAFAALFAFATFLALSRYEWFPEPWMAAMNLAWIPAAMGTCVMIAGTISREREGDTLLMLVTVPAARSEILWRKCLTAIHGTSPIWLLIATLGSLLVLLTIDTWYWFTAFLGQGLAMFTAAVGLGAFIAANCRTTFLAQASAIFCMLFAGVLPLWSVMVFEKNFLSVLPGLVGLTLAAGVIGWQGGRQAFDRYRLK